MLTPQMVITDLDGTLLNDSKKVSQEDIGTLKLLGEMDICRVVATGRSLYSLSKVADASFPFDYVVFSTGAGVMNWQTGELMYAAHLKEKEVSFAIKTFINAGMSFMVHDLVPDNHRFLYYDADCGNSDFKKRREIYSDFAIPLSTDPPNYKNASQLLAIVPENLQVLEEIRRKLSSLRVVRATSPLDNCTMWMEVLPPEVSKGHTVEWLFKRLFTEHICSIAVGNDYNDLDMLNYVTHPFVVNNAPDDLKNIYKVTESNNNSGFTHAVKEVIDNTSAINYLHRPAR